MCVCVCVCVCSVCVCSVVCVQCGVCVCVCVCVCVHSICCVMCACVLKQLLFGELSTVRPCHKPKLSRRDVIVRDVQRFELDAHYWYGIL